MGGYLPNLGQVSGLQISGNASPDQVQQVFSIFPPSCHLTFVIYFFYSFEVQFLFFIFFSVFFSQCSKFIGLLVIKFYY